MGVLVASTYSQKTKPQVSDLDTGGKKHPFAVAYDGSYIQVFTFKDSALQVSTASVTDDYVNNSNAGSLKWNHTQISTSTNFPDSSTFGSNAPFTKKKFAVVSLGGLNYLFFVSDSNSVLRAIVFDPSQNGSALGWCRLWDVQNTQQALTVSSGGVSACRFGGSGGILVSYIAQASPSASHQIVHLFLDVQIQMDLKSLQWAGSVRSVDAGPLVDNPNAQGGLLSGDVPLGQMYIQMVPTIVPGAADGTPLAYKAVALLGRCNVDDDNCTDAGVLTSWDLHGAADWPSATVQVQAAIPVVGFTNPSTQEIPHYEVIHYRGVRLASDVAGRTILVCNDFAASGDNNQKTGMTFFTLQQQAVYVGTGLIPGFTPTAPENSSSNFYSRSDPSLLFTLTNNGATTTTDGVTTTVVNPSMCVFFSKYDDTTNLASMVYLYGTGAVTEQLLQPDIPKLANGQDGPGEHLTMIADPLPSPISSAWDNSSSSGTTGFDIFDYIISSSQSKSVGVEMQFNTTFGATFEGDIVDYAWDIETYLSLAWDTKTLNSSYVSSVLKIQTKSMINPFVNARAYLVQPTSQAINRPLPSLDVRNATFTGLPGTSDPNEAIQQGVCTPRYPASSTALPYDFFTYAQDPNDLSSFIPARISQQMLALYQAYENGGFASTNGVNIFTEAEQSYYTNGTYFNDVMRDFAVPFNGDSPNPNDSVEFKEENYGMSLALDGGGQSFQATGGIHQVENGMTIESSFKAYFGEKVEWEAFGFRLGGMQLMAGFQFTASQATTTSTEQSFDFTPEVYGNPLSPGANLQAIMYRLMPCSLWAKELQVFPDLAKQMYLQKYGDAGQSYPQFNCDGYKARTAYGVAQPQRILVTADYTPAP